MFIIQCLNIVLYLSKVAQDENTVRVNCSIGLAVSVAFAM